MSDHAVENLTVAVILSVLACTTAWTIAMVAGHIRRSRTSRRITELHAKVLDRFSTAPELLAYLEGPAGQRFFESVAMDIRDAVGRVLDAFQFGTVLVLLGLSLLIVRSGESDMVSRRALLWLGVPAVAVGAGLLISAGFSYRLSRSLGLLKKETPQTE